MPVTGGFVSSFPFNGAPPVYYEADLQIQKLNPPGVPGVIMNGTETSIGGAAVVGQYSAVREINGQQWFLTNADLLTTTTTGGVLGSFAQINTGYASYAMVRNFDGTIVTYTASAGQPTPMVWVPGITITNTILPSYYVLAEAGSATAVLSGSGLQTFSKPYSIAAGFVNVVGTIIRLKASATIANTTGSAGTLIPSFNLGGHLASQSTYTASVPTGTTGTIEWNQDFIVTATGTQTQMVGNGLYAISNGNSAISVGAPNSVVTSNAVNQAAAIVVVPSVTFGGTAAGNAAFNCTGYQFCVEVLFPATVL